MITVKTICIYPIKGMLGCVVKSAKALQRGFEHDRRYMLIDKQGTFISQRTHPILVYFKPEIIENELVVHYKDQSYRIALSTSMQNTVTTTIFEHNVPATEVNQEINHWFSSIIKEEVRLVKMLDNNIRYKKLIKGPEKVEVSFADGYPYLILGTASVEKLNDSLEKPILIDRFRANIIIESSVPHVEDDLEKIAIGDTQFLIVKPCARCQVITIDQKSGVKSKEPISTLSSYRKKDNKIYFGANAICLKESIVRIGDEIIVL